MRAKKIIARTIWTLTGLATFIALFYAEENWRGARAWQAAQREYAKSGESLDYAKFIPPPIPDDQNLGAIPLFAQASPTKEKPYLHPLALQRALREGGDGPSLLWPQSQHGEPLDLHQLKQDLGAFYTGVFKGTRPPPPALAQFDAIYPFIAVLRDASATRPYCRFKIDYSIHPFQSLQLITEQVALARILMFHALLALDAHQTDLALGDPATTGDQVAVA